MLGTVLNVFWKQHRTKQYVYRHLSPTYYEWTEVLIDSGLKISLLKATVFEELKTDTITLKDSDLTVIESNVQKMELSSMVNLSIDAGGIKTFLSLYIVPGLDRTVVLGKEKPSPDKF